MSLKVKDKWFVEGVSDSHLKNQKDRDSSVCRLCRGTMGGKDKTLCKTISIRSIEDTLYTSKRKNRFKLDRINFQHIREIFERIAHDPSHHHVTGASQHVAMGMLYLTG